MSERIIKTTFSWNGVDVNKETFGYEGKACASETAYVEEALHGHSKQLKFKAEALRSKTIAKDKRITA